MYKVNSNFSTLTSEGILPILQNDTWFQKLSPKITENALIFCTLVYLHYYYFKDKNGDDKNDKKNPFQRIGTDLIIKILARDYYKEILQRLTELDIIDVNNSYCTGLYSKSYRLNDKFLKQKPVARIIRYNISKIEKLNQYFIEQKLFEYQYLLPQYNNLQLIHIDIDGALNFIETNKNDIKNIEHYYRQVYKINSGYTRKISVSPENNRVHTSLTSFPKKLRQFLCLVDNETGELNFNSCTIDGKNTQPLLICSLMEKEGYEILSDFKALCLNGTLYNQMAKELGESRAWVKEYIMKAILFTFNNSEYTHNLDILSENDKQKYKISIYFKNRFPDIYNWLKSKKQELKFNSSSRKKNTGGSLLAKEIQKMEAELWIHHLLKELPTELIYITIHDSLMLFNPTDEQIRFLEMKVKEIGKKLYDIDIPLSIE